MFTLNNINILRVTKMADIEKFVSEVNSVDIAINVEQTSDVSASKLFRKQPPNCATFTDCC